MCETVLEKIRLAKAKVEPTYKLFKLENMTVISPPLLKVYYWEYFGIDKLNDKLKADETNFEHIVEMPSRQLNTRPLKIILWIRNMSEDMMELRLKRIQNCTCTPLETRVGFNQFRQLFHCPHRRLIHILQDQIKMKAGELVAMRIVFYYFLFGEHTLTFEMRSSDSRVIMLHFKVNIIGFDPIDCVLTKELIPVDLREYRRLVQPIWVHNITKQHLNFSFASRERGLKLLNSTLTVPRLSVWPLMVEYRPSDYMNELDFTMGFEGIRKKFTVKAQGVLDKDVADPFVPLEDLECADFPYVIYPNKIEFDLQQSDQHSLMVSIHNFNKTCLEFRWQNYIISDVFEVTFEPSIFRLKPHHSKLCVVNLRVFQCALHFKRIPLALEVHRIFDKSTKIAKELLEEVESIDDPKWSESSYLVHIFLHLNIKVNFTLDEAVDLHWEPPTSKKDRLSSKKTTTIFEKFYWDYLSKSSHMRPKYDPKVSNELCYNDVLQMGLDSKAAQQPSEVSRNSVLRIISQLIAECVRDLAKNWRFIPVEFAQEMC